MIKFKYRYCKVHMARFVSGDLSEDTRRRIARYIDACEDCYREYMRHREFGQQLERNLPALGNPDAQRINQLWLAVQRDLQAPAESRDLFRDFGAAASLRFSYGLLVLAISVALLLPLMISYHTSTFSLILPSVPESFAIARTPTTAIANRSPASATSQANARGNAPPLQNTPAPRL